MKSGLAAIATLAALSAAAAPISLKLANSLHDPNRVLSQKSSDTVLQAAANIGETCLVVAKRHDGNRPGHIAAVVPEHANRRAVRDAADNVLRPLQSQAGRVNHRFSPGARAWWSGTQFEFFAFWRHG